MFKWIDHAIDCLFGYQGSLHGEIVDELTVQAVNQFAAEGEKILCIMLSVKFTEQVHNSLKRTGFHLVDDVFSPSATCEMLITDKKDLDIGSIQSCTGILIFTGYGDATFSGLNRILETMNLSGKQVLGLIGVSQPERVMV